MRQRQLSTVLNQNSFVRFRLICSAIVAATILSGFARAEDVVEVFVAEAAVAVAEEEEELVQVIAAPVRPAFSDADLERWVFQNQRTAANARKQMAAMLKLKAEDIGRVCALTDAQQRKLRLAGRGDISRFFDRYEAIKQKYQKTKRDQQARNQVFQEISPLQTTLRAGLFHDDSFFHKSLRNTLTTDQFASYRVVAEERHSFRSRAQIELTANMLEQGIPLRDEQRQKLLALLLAETKPSPNAGQYGHYVIMYQLSKVADKKLKPILDDVQWKVINQQLQQMRGMEAWLRKAGHLPEEDDEEEREDVGQPAEGQP